MSEYIDAMEKVRAQKKDDLMKKFDTFLFVNREIINYFKFLDEEFTQIKSNLNNLSVEDVINEYEPIVQQALELKDGMEAIPDDVRKTQKMKDFIYDIKINTKINRINEQIRALKSLQDNISQEQRLERERLAQERLAKLERERLEQERLAKLERERLEKLEKERLAQERFAERKQEREREKLERHEKINKDMEKNTFKDKFKCPYCDYEGIFGITNTVYIWIAVCLSTASVIISYLYLPFTIGSILFALSPLIGFIVGYIAYSIIGKVNYTVENIALLSAGIAFGYVFLIEYAGEKTDFLKITLFLSFTIVFILGLILCIFQYFKFGFICPSCDKKLRD